MGTLATSVNAKNPQTSNHSKSTLIPLFQKLVVMLIVALPVTFGPGLPALIGRATWRYTGCIKKTQPRNFLRNHFAILKHKRF